MLFMAHGRFRSEGLEKARSERSARVEGVACLAEYVVPGSLRFLGIYQAENLTALSRFLRGRGFLDLDSVEPILHLENMLILEEGPPSGPADDLNF